MKIVRLPLSNLQNQEHFQFMTDMEKLFFAAFVARSLEDATIETALDVIAIYLEFKAAWKVEDDVMEIIRKNALTDPIAGLDGIRDNNYWAVKLITDANKLSTNPEKTEAARKVGIVNDQYGDIRRQAYNKETGSIYNYTQELRANYANEIAILGLEDWITELEDANNEFQNYMNQRFSESGSSDMENARNARLTIDGIYIRLADALEAINLISGGSAYLNLMTEMNKRITYYKNTIATRKGVAKAQKEKEEAKNSK